MEELQARFDSRKSFYGKAKVECQKTTFEHIQNLYSYGTLVASVVMKFIDKKTIYKCGGYYSQTTRRHQREFFRQNGLTDDEIKKVFEDLEMESEW